MAEVSLVNLSFRYPGSAADTLAGLDLAISAGEAHALLGGSGAGKSTLLNLLSGLLPAEPGQVNFNGEDVSGRSPWDRRVTQVFQFPVLYEGMTVADNLAFPLREAPRAERRTRVAEIARRLGIHELLTLKPARLTLVQRQMVAIGRSLTRPDLSLVLLDEPLTAAEPEHKWQLRQALRALQQELGATMIYVTHDQAEALTFADRVSVLHEGRILQTATPRVLLEEPAHEHVGYFVGSPGMNLIDARMQNGQLLVGDEPVAEFAVADGPCRLGFRPEWARVSDGSASDLPGTLGVRVRGERILTVDRGARHGVVIAELEGSEIMTRQVLIGVPSGPGRLALDPERLLLFRDGWRLPVEPAAA